MCVTTEDSHFITGSAVALHCCKAHSKSIGKMENSTPCKIVTPENFILKLGTRDYVENITHYTNFHVHGFSGGFSTNRWNITLLWLFPVLSRPFFLVHTPSSNRASDFRGLWLKWRGSAQGRSFLGLGWWVTSFGEMCPKNPPKRGVNWHFQAKLACVDLGQCMDTLFTFSFFSV